MRVLVIGAGALGSLFAARLASAGHEVLLLGRSKNHVDVIGREGLTIQLPVSQTQEVVRFAASASEEPGPPADLIIFLTKSQDTRAAAGRASSHVHAGTTLLSLQNGIGNLEIITELLPAHRALAGVTAVGSRLVAPGRIEVTQGVEQGTAISSFGPWMNSCSFATAEQIASTLSEAGLKAEAHEDVQPIIWTKLAMACAMNAVASIARIGVGPVLDSAAGRELIASAVEEVAAVANAKHIRLDPDRLREKCFSIYAGGLSHVPSMAMDVVEGRPTEVGALNEALVREADAHDVEVPVNRTLAAFVRLIEASYDSQLERSGQ